MASAKTMAFAFVLMLAAACADAPPSGPREAASEQAPKVAEIVCEADGSTSVLTPRVEAGRDGVHLQVVSHLDEPASLSGFGPDVSPGKSDWVLAQPPGVVKAACWPFSDHGTLDEPLTQPVEILDPNGYYVSSELQCPKGDPSWASIRDFFSRAAGNDGDPIEVVRADLQGLRASDVLRRVGYPADADAPVGVIRNGKTLVVVSVQQSDRGGWILPGGQGCSSSGIQL